MPDDHGQCYLHFAKDTSWNAKADSLIEFAVRHFLYFWVALGHRSFMPNLAGVLLLGGSVLMVASRNGDMVGSDIDHHRVCWIISWKWGCLIGFLSGHWLPAFLQSWTFCPFQSFNCLLQMFQHYKTLHVFPKALLDDQHVDPPGIASSVCDAMPRVRAGTLRARFRKHAQKVHSFLRAFFLVNGQLSVTRSPSIHMICTYTVYNCLIVVVVAIFLNSQRMILYF